MITRVAFVCTGNTCRSPMAESIFKHIMREKQIKNVYSTSFGIHAPDGLPMTENAKKALKILGIRPHAHKSKCITKELVEKQNYIFCMTEEHKSYLKKERVFAFNELAHLGEIMDPYGYDVEIYLRTAKQIYASMEIIVEMLLKSIANRRD